MASLGAKATPRLIGNFYRRPTARYSHLCNRLGALALLLLPVAMLAFRFGYLSPVTFLWAMGAVVALGVFALFAGLAATRDIFDDDAAGAGVAMRGAVFAIIALAPLAWAGAQAVIHPKINDVATDPTDFPIFSKLVAERQGTPWPAGKLSADDAALLRDAYPGLGPHGYSTDPNRVAQAVAKLAALRRWETIDAPFIAGAEPQREEGVIPLPRSPERDLQPRPSDTLFFEFTARSLVLNVPTDIAIRLSRDNDITVVDARAAGRYTAHDLGRGVALLTGFLDELDIELLGVTGEGSFADDEEPEGDEPDAAGVLPVPQSSDPLPLQ
ncbi:MAG: DUF1499 domain-containing protein [Pseudomonadota bacterium]